MSRRITAALLASLTFAAVLVAVPLVGSEPAEAHDIYHWADEEQPRCSYDPISNTNQCWTVTVRVRVPSHHSHARVCPTGTTGTYPDCSPILPTPDPVPTIPTIPDLKDPKTTEPKDTTPPTPKDTTPPTTAPPTTTTTQPEPVCYRPNHAHGNTCHGPHGDPPCGTGAWAPHSGHTPVQRPPCTTEPPRCPAGQTGTPPNCTEQHTTTYVVTCAPNQEPVEVVQRHKHGIGGACHRQDISHCPAGSIEIGGHGSQDCQGTDAVDNIITRIQHLIRQGGADSLNAARDAIKKALADLGEDGLRNAEMNQHLGQELLKLYNSLPVPVRITGTYLFCVGLAAAAVKAAPVTGGTSAAWFVTHAAGLGCTLGLEHYIPKFFSDEGDSTDGDDQYHQPTPTTQPPTSQPTPTEQAIEDAAAERDAAHEAMQENPTFENRLKYSEAYKRYACLTGKLKLACK